MNNKPYYRRYRRGRRYQLQKHQQHQSHPVQQRQGNPNAVLFQGNLANSMRFGSKGHELSGYVKRQVVLIDQHGNKQIATEKQFFNSARRLGKIRIADDEGDY
jgi:hypothetical protein